MSMVFKFVKSKCQSYMNEIFRPAENIRINTRNSFFLIKPSFLKNQYWAKGLVLNWTNYIEQNSRIFEENQKFEYF